MIRPLRRPRRRLAHGFTLRDGATPTSALSIWFAPSTPLRASNHDLSCGSAVYWLRSLVVAKRLLRRSRNFAARAPQFRSATVRAHTGRRCAELTLAETTPTDVDGNVVATPCQT